MNSILTSNKKAHLKNTTEYTLHANTLVEALELRRKNRADFLIFMDMKNNENKVTADNVYNGALSVAQYLLADGLKKNDKVVIMLTTSIDFVYVYFGILMAGGVPVPVSQPAGTSNLEKYLDNLRHIIIDCEAKFFITYDKIKMLIGGLMKMPNLVNDYIFTDEMFQNPVSINSYKELPEIVSSDLALIQYTSGTTGKPKGVMLSHGNLLHNVHGIGTAAGMTVNDIGISWLPLYHDMGLIGTMFSSLYWNWPLVLMMPEAFIFKPQWWLENITKYGVTMGVAPNFGYHYCVTRIPDSALSKLDLHTWRFALNGAEPIDRITLNKFVEKFKSSGLREDVFWPVYGMAENSLAATFPSQKNPTIVRRFHRQTLEDEHIAVDTDSNEPKTYTDLVSVGFPLVGQEIRIVDKKGNTLKERQVGQILVKSPSLSTGYYKNPEATNDTFKDGWLYTGDMGFVLDDLLYVSGRIKEMIIKRGKNIYPYDVERIASTVKGVRLGCIAAFAVENESQGTEDLVLVCETTIKDKEKLDELKKNISNEILARLGISPDDIRLVPKGTIPKTTSGKLQRVLCKKIYLEDDFIIRKSKNFFILMQTIILSYFHLFKYRVGKVFNRS